MISITPLFLQKLLLFAGVFVILSKENVVKKYIVMKF